MKFSREQVIGSLMIAAIVISIVVLKFVVFAN